MKKKKDLSNVDKLVIHILEQEKPKTMNRLIKKIQSKHSIEEKEIIQSILYLQEQGRIRVENIQVSLPSTIMEYFFSMERMWYWIVITVSLTNLFSTFLMLERTGLLLYFKYLVGIIFAFFLPGYTIIKIIFPERKTYDVEMIGLSISTSITLIILIGFFLSYSPWAINGYIMDSILSLCIIVVATIGVLNQYRLKNGIHRN
jgi:hypothetical protein